MRTPSWKPAEVERPSPRPDPGPRNHAGGIPHCSGLGRALGATGTLQVWQLMVVAFVAMSAAGIYNPAYSALLPRVLHDDQLLAANGVEAASRPVLQQALGAIRGPDEQPLQVTRLARGVLAGSELEYVDLGTIAHALADRR